MSFGSSETRKAVWAKANGLCHICDLPMSRFELTVDHIIPRIFGGSDKIENLAAAHQSCNVLRGATPLAEYKKKLQMRKRRLGVTKMS